MSALKQSDSVLLIQKELLNAKLEDDWKVKKRKRERGGGEDDREVKRGRKGINFFRFICPCSAI